MSEQKRKRIRSSNFSADEENMLVNCVLVHKNVIENKCTDLLTVGAK